MKVTEISGSKRILRRKKYLKEGGKFLIARISWRVKYLLAKESGRGGNIWLQNNLEEGSKIIWRKGKYLVAKISEGGNIW